ncbi:MAG: chemotaxis protein CheW [Pseudomonadota bacterium]
MVEKAEVRAGYKTMELVTFHVGEALCGMDILQVKEINKQLEITPVPQAPTYVLGVLNLRGKIATVIDLARKMGLSATDLTKECRNIMVSSENEDIGLLVDRIGDALLAERDEIEPPPANIGGVQGRFFEGVFKAKNRLIGILKLEEVLSNNE